MSQQYRLDDHAVTCRCTGCKAVKAATQRARYAKRGKQIMRSSHLQRTYGLDAQQYAVLERRQKGLCAICRQPEPCHNKAGEPYRLAVDHDHTTGQVRALLCSRCNQALGLMDDDPSRLTAAAKYLRKHHGMRVDEDLHGLR